MRGHADVIVTSNLKDFPESSLSGLDIEVQHPNLFLCYELEFAPGAIMQILHKQAQDTGKEGRPRLTVDDVLDELTRCGACDFANQTRQLLEASRAGYARDDPAAG